MSKEKDKYTISQQDFANENLAKLEYYVKNYEKDANEASQTLENYEKAREDRWKQSDEISKDTTMSDAEKQAALEKLSNEFAEEWRPKFDNARQELDKHNIVVSILATNVLQHSLFGHDPKVLKRCIEIIRKFRVPVQDKMRINFSTSYNTFKLDNNWYGLSDTILFAFATMGDFSAVKWFVETPDAKGGSTGTGFISKPSLSSKTISDLLGVAMIEYNVPMFKYFETILESGNYKFEVTNFYKSNLDKLNAMDFASAIAVPEFQPYIAALQSELDLRLSILDEIF